MSVTHEPRTTAKRAVSYLSQKEKRLLKILALEAETSESEYLRRAILDKARESERGQQYLRDQNLS